MKRRKRKSSISKRIKRNRRLRRKSAPDKKFHLSESIHSPKLSKRELTIIQLESARINASRAKSGYQDVD